MLSHFVCLSSALFALDVSAQSWSCTYNQFSDLQEWYESPQNNAFNPLQSLGGNGQWFSGPNVHNISTSPPPGCYVDQAVYVLRHGSRYPDPSAYQQWIALYQKVQNATFTAHDSLSFLSAWKPVLVLPDQDISAESLTGYRELYDMGVALRFRYPGFYSPNSPWSMWANDYPRVVQSAQLFARGYMGPNSSLGNIYVVTPTDPAAYGNSLSPSDLCPKYLDSSGMAQTTEWNNIYLPSIVQRLNGLIEGNLTLNTSDVDIFPYLCGFESSITGRVSPFCFTFTDEEFMDYEYQQDLRYYYGQGPGSGGNQTFMFPFLIAVIELLSSGPAVGSASSNHSTSGAFQPPPLVVAALNDGQISQLVSEIGVFDNENPLPSTSANASRTYLASRFVSMRGTIAFERLNCKTVASGSNSTFVRIRLNDAVYPVPSCQSGPGSSCPVTDYQILIAQKYATTGGFTANCGTTNTTIGYSSSPKTTFFDNPEVLNFVRVVKP